MQFTEVAGANCARNPREGEQAILPRVPLSTAVPLSCAEYSAQRLPTQYMIRSDPRGRLVDGPRSVNQVNHEPPAGAYDERGPLKQPAEGARVVPWSWGKAPPIGNNRQWRVGRCIAPTIIR